MAEVEPGSLQTRGTGDPGPSSPSGKPPMSQGKKLALGAAAIGGLFLVYLFAKSRSGSSGQTTTGYSGTAPSLVLPSSTQDATSSADYAALASQLNTLSNQLNQNNTTNQSNITGQTIAGAGYWNGPSASPYSSYQGTQYNWIPGWPGAQGIQASGGTVYYQPTPGVFSPIPGNVGQGLPPNTPLFEQIP